mmetsp:Transcript_208/g.316  ORF Transcript_208/g.316 Transcript_208/m.316 type:complete len:252 (-) Transcript_208:27-782(-)
MWADRGDDPLVSPLAAVRGDAMLWLLSNRRLATWGLAGGPMPLSGLEVRGERGGDEPRAVLGPLGRCGEVPWRGSTAGKVARAQRGVEELPLGATARTGEARRVLSFCDPAAASLKSQRTAVLAPQGCAPPTRTCKAAFVASCRSWCTMSAIARRAFSNKASCSLRCLRVASKACVARHAACCLPYPRPDGRPLARASAAPFLSDVASLGKPLGCDHHPSSMEAIPAEPGADSIPTAFCSLVKNYISLSRT